MVPIKRPPYGAFFLARQLPGFLEGVCRTPSAPLWCVRCVCPPCSCCCSLALPAAAMSTAGRCGWGNALFGQAATKDAKPADLPPLQTFDPHSMAGGQGQSYDEPDSKPAASGLSFHPVITRPAPTKPFAAIERDVTGMIERAAEWGWSALLPGRLRPVQRADL